MKLKEDIEDIYDIHKEAGFKNKSKTKKKFNMKPGDLKKKIYSYISGQSGVEKKIKDKAGHMLETSNRALDRILNHIEKAEIS